MDWVCTGEGTTPRFTPEDFRIRSLYGVGDDWPIDYDDLEPFYQEAEERIGVAGVQGPPEYDPRSRDYPMDGLPLSYNLGAVAAMGREVGDSVLAESGIEELAAVSRSQRLHAL